MMITGWIICALGIYKFYLGVKTWYNHFERKRLEDYFIISMTFYMTLMIYICVSSFGFIEFVRSVLFFELLVGLLI